MYLSTRYTFHVIYGEVMKNVFYDNFFKYDLYASVFTISGNQKLYAD